MIRNTSRHAYRRINADGTLRSQKDLIFSAINMIPSHDRNYGITLKELARQTGFEINAVAGRVNELKKEEFVEECAKRKCRITGRIVTPVTVS
jgi:DNA-binding MarR family transcriptional regulator|tara:strand:- start:1392 stop:1670 length:279 start_codon:yes stop_codon:yes gene_type:complete